MAEPAKTNVTQTKFGFRSIGTKPGPNKPPANGRGPGDSEYVVEMLIASWDNL